MRRRYGPGVGQLPELSRQMQQKLLWAELAPDSAEEGADSETA